VHATSIEADLWDALTTTLLNPEYLITGLETAQRRHSESDSLRRDRLSAIDAQIARERKRLDAITMRLIDTDFGSEVAASLERTQDDIQQILERLTNERAQLAAVRSEGLTAAEAESIQSYADKIRDGLAGANDADRRRLYEMLSVRGVVHLDPDGVLLGHKHRYRVEWTAAVPLLHTSSRFRNPVIQ
jgi:hypothetical protein